MKKQKWEIILLHIVENIKADVTAFLSYIFSVTIQIALLYYIMKILGEFAIFIFEKNEITDPAKLDIIPVVIWGFGMIYIIIKTKYSRKR